MKRRMTLTASAAFFVSTMVSADSVFSMLDADPSAAALVIEAQSRLHERDARSAYVLLREAQDMGSGDAYALMARMYEGGQGVEANPRLASELYRLAAQHGNADGMYHLAAEHLAREETEEGMRWLQSAVEKGQPEALFVLAKQSLNAGRLQEGRDMLLRAMVGGSKDASAFLAEQLENGSRGFPKDTQQAFYLYHELAKTGDTDAMNAVAYFFAHGLHGIKSPVTAAHWYHESSKRGNEDATKAYAWMAENGVGMDKDIEEARWYRQELRQ